uniref:Uncharacterized protein n=1 Tax=Planktothrix agardhii TaxID=1160 RepID=A0A1J1JGT3_PLAAG|nr:protein of unknown function [Planktothrix agardhii]
MDSSEERARVLFIPSPALRSPPPLPPEKKIKQGVDIWERFVLYCLIVNKLRLSSSVVRAGDS